MLSAKTAILTCLAALSSLICFHLIPGLADTYRQRFFLPLSLVVRRSLSLLPFSPTEALIRLLCALLLFFPVKLLFSIRRPAPRRLGEGVLRAFSAALALYCALWAPLYACSPTAAEAPARADTLAQFCGALADSLNELSPVAAWEDEKTILLDAARLMSQVTGQPLTPPRVSSSVLMHLLGASGLYVPFTFEALLSPEEPPVNLPFTACHELAHQAGFARESEASYLAWLGCLKGSPPMRYSGNLSMLLSAMSRLRVLDEAAWRTIVARMNPKVLFDFRVANGLCEARPAAGRRVQRGVSDAFLHLNGQSDGLASYDHAALMALHRYLSLGRLP